MKRLLMLWAWACACMTGVVAQVSVEVAIDREQFLPDESLIIKVRISNFSGQTLTLGRSEDWLSFAVEAHDKFIVRELQAAPVAGEFTLESSSVATKRVDLAPCYNLTQAGRYSVTATVRIPAWGRSFSSRPKAFDIRSGNKLWEAAFGLPSASAGAKDSALTPEVRKYVLQQAVNLKEITLYVRVTDASGSRTFRVFPLGRMVSFSQPEPQVDQVSNLHVLFQDGARTFNYCVVSPDGLLSRRETHEYTSSRPELRANQDGKIVVVGGVRRVTPLDVPPTSASSPPADDKQSNP